MSTFEEVDEFLDLSLSTLALPCRANARARRAVTGRVAGENM